MHDKQGVGFLSFDLADISDDVLNIDSMCRLCMNCDSYDSSMIDISGENPFSSIPIPQLFIDGIGININHNSSKGMPRKVCLKCLEELNLFTIFKKRSLNVDAKLQQIVSRRQKLREAQALYGPDIFDEELTSDSSIPPPYFETSSEDESDLSITKPTLQTTEEQNLPGFRNIELSSHHDSAEIEETTNEDIKVDEGIQTDCNFIDVPVVIESNTEVCLSPEEYAVSVEQEEVLNDGDDESVSIYETVEDESEFHVVDASTNVLEEVVLTDVLKEGADRGKLDSTKEASSNSLFFPKTSKNDEKNLPKRQSKKRGFRDPLLVPEIFVVENNKEKQLAFRCKSCKKTFHTNSAFRRHLTEHTLKKGEVCTLCDKWFVSRTALIRHERIHSGDRPFKCQLCERAFSQKEILQRHVATHFDTKPFQCKHCDKSYTQKEGLNNHIKIHHQKAWEFTQYPCILCDKTFCHASGLSRHMMVHSGRQMTCKFCNRGFHDASSMKRHVKNQHPTESQNLITSVS